MLTDIEVEGFQSLRKLSLRLGKLTVITGATGSGKSAVIRAVRLAAFNAKGNAFITRGERVCQAGLGAQDEDWFAVITRGITRGKDAYRIARKAPGGVLDSSASVEEFTKLAGGVPEEVTACHRLTELNFAAQFDTPFLLSQSAGEIARTLGRLTNVTLLFEAARECSTRRQRLTRQLTQRQADLERLNNEARRFVHLPARRNAVQAAEAALQEAQRADVKATTLAAHLSRLEVAQGRLEATAAAVPQVPDLAALEALSARHSRLAGLLGAADEAHVQAGRYHIVSASARQSASQAEADLQALLVSAGRCPTCGQPVGKNHEED